MKLYSKDFNNKYGGTTNVRGVLFENPSLKDYYFRDFSTTCDRGSGDFLVSVVETEEDGRTDSWTVGYDSLQNSWKHWGKDFPTVAEVGETEFWGSIPIMEHIAGSFLNFRLSSSEDIDSFYEELIKDHFDSICKNKRPEYKGVKALILDDTFINPYQVVAGLPALPPIFRPRIKVWSNDIQFREDHITGYYTLGNWVIDTPVPTEEYAKKNYCLSNKWYDWIPKKYQQNACIYVDTIIKNLQGVEL